MLCAKNLKVALAAILGVVGLVSVGTAHAEINLNPPTGTLADPEANTPQYFAAEKLAAAAGAASVTARTATPVTAMATSAGYTLTAPNIPVGFLAADGNYYFRFDLLHGGVNNAGMAKFDTTKVGTNAAPTITGTGVSNATVTRVQYSAGSSGVVFAIDPTDSPTANVESGAATVGWALASDTIQLRVASPTDQETFQIRLSIWGDRASASRGLVSDNGEQLWAGSAVIAQTRRTVGASVTAPQEITASVVSNFREFVSATPDMGKLATVGVTFTNMYQVTRLATGDDRMHQILDHAGAAGGAGAKVITLPDVLDYVAVEATGDNAAASYNFGEFYVDTTCATNRMARTVPDDTPTTATPADRVQITEKLTGRISAAGAHMFCANVAANINEQMCTNADGTKVACETYKRIEAVGYTLKVDMKYKGINGLRAIAAAAMGGSIKRDGTEVRISYLTTATDFGADRQVWEGWQGGSYNQRLVIVNHGSVDAAFSLGDFAMEEGVTVTALEAATGTVPAGSSMVIPVRDMITIVGRSRTSAKLTVVASEASVSVATSQITLPEGQTDTVRYHPR